jgi:putative transposase
MKKQELNKLNHSVFLIHSHLVLITKYRKKCITKPMLARLEEILRATCADWDCELKEFNGEADHVHCLISMNPKAQPSKLVNNLKTVSSRLIRKEFKKELRRVFWKPYFWSRTYCFVSCGGAPLEIVKRYIKEQGPVA